MNLIDLLDDDAEADRKRCREMARNTLSEACEDSHEAKHADERPLPRSPITRAALPSTSRWMTTAGRWPRSTRRLPSPSGGSSPVPSPLRSERPALAHSPHHGEVGMRHWRYTMKYNVIEYNVNGDGSASKPRTIASGLGKTAAREKADKLNDQTAKLDLKGESAGIKSYRAVPA
jgi:hypothetical protein